MRGNLRLYDAKLVPWDTAGTSKRFATRRGDEGLEQLSLRFPTVVENSPRTAQPSCGEAPATPQPHPRDEPRSGTSRVLLAFDLPGPRMRRRAGGGTARRVAGKDAGQFGVRAGCPVDKPRNPHAYLPGFARKAPHPGALLFGIATISVVTFSWASKRK